MVVSHMTLHLKKSPSITDIASFVSAKADRISEVTIYAH